MIETFRPSVTTNTVKVSSTAKNLDHCRPHIAVIATDAASVNPTVIDSPFMISSLGGSSAATRAVMVVVGVKTASDTAPSSTNNPT